MDEVFPQGSQLCAVNQRRGLSTIGVSRDPANHFAWVTKGSSGAKKFQSQLSLAVFQAQTEVNSSRNPIINPQNCLISLA